MVSANAIPVMMVPTSHSRRSSSVLMLGKNTVVTKLGVVGPSTANVPNSVGPISTPPFTRQPRAFETAIAENGRLEPLRVKCDSAKPVTLVEAGINSLRKSRNVRPSKTIAAWISPDPKMLITLEAAQKFTNIQPMLEFDPAVRPTDQFAFPSEMARLDPRIANDEATPGNAPNVSAGLKTEEAFNEAYSDAFVCENAIAGPD